MTQAHSWCRHVNWKWNVCVNLIVVSSEPPAKIRKGLFTSKSRRSFWKLQRLFFSQFESFCASDCFPFFNPKFLQNVQVSLMCDKKITNSAVTRVKWKIALYSSFSSDVSKPKMCRWVIIGEVHIFRWTVPYKIEFLLWINLLMYSSNLVANSNFILKIIIKAVRYVVVVLQDAVSTLSVRILWTSESLSSVLITTRRLKDDTTCQLWKKTLWHSNIVLISRLTVTVPPACWTSTVLTAVGVCFREPLSL